MHRLGQMRRLRMLQEQKSWKREVGFDYIDTAAELDARRSRTNLVLEPFFYSKTSNPRWPHTHDEFTLEIIIDVEGLRMEIVLSQPEPPPQCDAATRRLPAVDTGSVEPGTPRRSPAIDTGSDEPGVSRAESTEREKIVPLQAGVDVFFALQMHKPGARVYSVSTRGRGRRRERPTNYLTSSRCSREIRETNEEAAAAKDDNMDYQAKQAI